MRRDYTLATDTPMRLTPTRRFFAGLLLFAAIGVLWLVVRNYLYLETGQQADQDAMNALYANSTAITEILSYLSYLSIGSAFAALVVLAGIAFVSGRRSVAVGVVVLVVGANLTTQFLKRFVFDRPDFIDHLPNSLPSGHTTVIASLVIAALVVTPRTLQYPTVLAASFLATWTGAATVVAGWHRPSDVLAALIVCLIWFCAVTIVVAWRADYAQLATAFWALGGAGIAVVALIAIGVRPTGGWSGLIDAVFVLAALALATAFMVAICGHIMSPRRMAPTRTYREDRDPEPNEDPSSNLGHADDEHQF